MDTLELALSKLEPHAWAPAPLSLDDVLKRAEAIRTDGSETALQKTDSLAKLAAETRGKTRHGQGRRDRRRWMGS